MSLKTKNKGRSPKFVGKDETYFDNQLAASGQRPNEDDDSDKSFPSNPKAPAITGEKKSFEKDTLGIVPPRMGKVNLPAKAQRGLFK